MMIARAEAIQGYANLEQNLCELFSYVSDTNPVVAGTIFFRLTNTRSRLAIINSLIRLKHQNTYNLFWNSVDKMLKDLDSDRNSIVHWHMAVNMATDSKAVHVAEFILGPPNFWARDENTPQFNITDITEFTMKCGFVSDALRNFVNHLNHRTPVGRPLPDIFHQALAYPRL